MAKYEETLQAVKEYIIGHDDFLVISHVGPDGDAVGSSLAMANLLKNLNKRFTVVNEGSCPRKFSYLHLFDQIINLSKHSVERTFEHIIAVDVADFSRLGDASHLFAENAYIVNIDHHPTNTLFGQLNLIRSDAASTTEILFDLIYHHFPQELDTHVAESLYTGLLTDTGGFRYANTTQAVLEKAANLLKYDIKPGKIAERALETISASFLELLKISLNSLTFAFERKVALLSISLADLEKAGATKEDVDGLVAYPRNIEGVEVGILLKEWAEDEVKVSLRSKDVVDVSAIAQKNGGGGHVRAAGFTFYGDLSAAKQHILRELEHVLGDESNARN